MQPVPAGLPAEVVRALLLLRANVMARGTSGVRPAVVDQMLALLRADVLPVVPRQGSVGASGDLAPLAHLALVLIGEGEATVGGAPVSGAVALQYAGLEPLELLAKEGLALINGTQVMASLGVIASGELLRLCSSANVAVPVARVPSERTASPPAFDARSPARSSVTSRSNASSSISGAACSKYSLL